MYNTINTNQEVVMPKIIPMVITNKDILVKKSDEDTFVSYTMSNKQANPNIPFYHQFAAKISESQYYFKQFLKDLYGKKVSKYVLAIIVPDDTSPLEQIFINEFFLHCDACKAVAQTTMSRVLTKDYTSYISISKTDRNVILQYINNDDIMAEKMYDVNKYDTNQVFEDAKRIHIDVEYDEVPIFVNDFNMNMDDFHQIGQVITTKDFLDKIANVDIEKA